MLPYKKQPIPELLFSETERWASNNHYLFAHRKDARTKITHTLNERSCLCIPDEELWRFYNCMQMDYCNGIKFYLSDYVGSDDSCQEPKVNVFWDIDTKDEDDDWTIEYQIGVVRCCAQVLSEFFPAPVSRQGLFIYMSTKHDPNNPDKKFTSMHIQTQKCVMMSKVQQMLVYTVQVLEQYDDRSTKARGWAELVDSRVCQASAGNTYRANLRMNYSVMMQACLRCSNPESKTRGMGRCFHHQEEVPGEYRVVQVFDVNGNTVPAELERVKNSMTEQWKACCIRPLSSTHVDVAIHVPATLIAKTATLRKKHGAASTSIRGKWSRVPADDERIEMVNGMIFESFPEHWRRLKVKKLEHQDEVMWRFDVKGPGADMCGNRVPQDGGDVGKHGNKSIYFCFDVSGWWQMCYSTKEEPESRVNRHKCSGWRSDITLFSESFRREYFKPVATTTTASAPSSSVAQSSMDELFDDVQKEGMKKRKAAEIEAIKIRKQYKRRG